VPGLFIYRVGREKPGTNSVISEVIVGARRVFILDLMVETGPTDATGHRFLDDREGLGESASGFLTKQNARNRPSGNCFRDRLAFDAAAASSR
jgi:hypothetical protein